MAIIEVNNVSREFKVYRKNTGFINTVKSLFHREYDIKKAVDGISFDIEEGELVGFIGPNGAGKSTTIKMLSGILVPSDGHIQVCGREPYKHRMENAMDIGVVFGQRTKLYWDLPMEDTFQLYQKIYHIDMDIYRNNMDFFVDLLAMKEFLNTPVRQLSLGQRMRAELALSLLHNPFLLYLDEATIGLDVVAKNRMRRFIRQINREKKTTVILTTHDMKDIEEVCDRIIMIDKGRLLYDGSLKEFKVRFSPGYLLIAEFEEENVVITDPRFQVIREEGQKKWIQFKKEDISVPEAMAYIVKNFLTADISIKEPEIEETVRKVYESVAVIADPWANKL